MNAPSLSPLNPVLIVDDDAETLRSFSMTLRMHGISHIVECNDSRQVPSLFTQQPFDAMLLDLTMPFVSGEEILCAVSENYPEVPVIVVTAMDEVNTAVMCIKKGAFDYMVKPVEKSRLVSGVRRAIEIKELRDQSRLLKERMLCGQLLNPAAFSAMVTRNKAMISIFQYVESIAASRQPILVTGETGVGKELMVKAIHALRGTRCPLVSVNVAGLDDTIFSDTLFGHVKGAYTGAAERRPGLVEKACGGILHLDEIGELSHPSQIKLLRLLQEGEYLPLGSDTAKIADISVIATTNLDLSMVQQSGQFRKDLYYRLSAHHIHIPPLRHRPDDVPLLLHHFIDEAARAFGKAPPTCSEEALAFIAQYQLPGNIRELRTIVHDAVGRNQTGTLFLRRFRDRASSKAPGFPCSLKPMPAIDTWSTNGMPERLPTIEEATCQLIRQALLRCNNNQSEAARLLGISRQRLARTAKKFNF